MITPVDVQIDSDKMAFLLADVQPELMPGGAPLSRMAI
jgi:hypothetical protein